MGRGLQLDELEAYRVELNNAQREGRPCKYKNPREVYAEDPNLDTYLVEKDDEQLKVEAEAIDSQKVVKLRDPGQEFAETSALLSDTGSGHQNEQSTPNPENLATDAELEDAEAGELPSEVQPPAEETPTDESKSVEEVPATETVPAATTPTEIPAQAEVPPPTS